MKTVLLPICLIVSLGFVKALADHSADQKSLMQSGPPSLMLLKDVDLEGEKIELMVTLERMNEFKKTVVSASHLQLPFSKFDIEKVDGSPASQEELEKAEGTIVVVAESKRKPSRKYLEVFRADAVLLRLK